MLTSIQGSNLTVLDLSYNFIVSLQQIAPLSNLPLLSHLSLRGNPIAELDYGSNPPFTSLMWLDLADTHLKDLNTLDNLVKTFPFLKLLLTKDTPLSKLPSATIFTIARVSDLEVLNHVKISSEERQNAEIYYLGTIAKELEKTSDVEEEAKILKNHQRWESLCRLHGSPKLTKPKTDVVDPDTLEARTTAFTFYVSKSDCKRAHQNYERKEEARRSNQLSNKSFRLPPTAYEKTSANLTSVEPVQIEHRDEQSKAPQREQASTPRLEEEKINPVSADDKNITPSTIKAHDIIEKVAYIPRSMSNYALQGKVGRLFTLPPPFTTTIRLFLEFDEWIASSTSSKLASGKRDKPNIDPSIVGDLSTNINNEQGSDDDSGWSLSQDDDDVYNDVRAWLKRRRERGEGKGKWVKRVIELESTTRGVGDFLGWKGFELGKEARVKVVVV